MIQIQFSRQGLHFPSCNAFWADLANPFKKGRGAVLFFKQVFMGIKSQSRVNQQNRRVAPRRHYGC